MGKNKYKITKIKAIEVVNNLVAVYKSEYEGTQEYEKNIDEIKAVQTYLKYIIKRS